jgi:hypothetical protein
MRREAIGGRRLALRPRLHGAALSNALSHCPTSDGRSFRAPSRDELYAGENRARMRAELTRAVRRSRGSLMVIALGRKAESLLEGLREEGASFVLAYLPHPSAQALAAGARGPSMRERERDWRSRLVALLGSAAQAAGVER